MRKSIIAFTAVTLGLVVCGVSSPVFAGESNVTPAPAQAAKGNDADTSSRNSDAESNVVPAVSEITEGDWKVQAWGKCHPTDCDWGTVPLVMFSDTICTNSHKYGIARWDPGFEEVTMTVRMDGSILVVETDTVFKDHSGRPAYHGMAHLAK